MNIQNNIDIFDNYTQEKLSPRERQDFDQSLQSDYSLKSAFEAHQMTVETVRQFERERLKHMLIHSAPPQRSNIRQIAPKIFRLSIAASILLVIGFGAFYMSQSDERLYASLDLQNSPNIMMSGQSATTFNRQNYENALALKEQGKLGDAIRAFDKVSKENINLYFIAQYDKALLQFKLGDKAAAKNTLDQLMQQPENHFIKDKAKKAINAMSKNWFF
jgi:tetratricopeptide (TPR) repeat protein